MQIYTECDCSEMFKAVAGYIPAAVVLILSSKAAAGEKRKEVWGKAWA
jgi:hypothetical protein